MNIIENLPFHLRT